MNYIIIQTKLEDDYYERNKAEQEIICEIKESSNSYSLVNKKKLIDLIKLKWSLDQFYQKRADNPRIFIYFHELLDIMITDHVFY